MKNQSNITETQGEILPESILELIDYLALSTKDIFYDLGSGIGNVVHAIFVHSKVQEAHGIELLESCYKRALEIQSSLYHYSELHQNGRKIDFHHGSFFDIPFTHATVIFLNSLCFTQHMLKKLALLIDSSDYIHTILSTRPIVYLLKYRLVKTLYIECSWDTALCYVYKKI